MSSKINGFDSRPAPVGPGRAIERPRDATSGGQGSRDSSGGVHITGTASHLAALEQTLQELPAVNEARVAEIRQAIEEGRYAVSAERIADGLARMEQALARLPAEEK
jgi:negative regulator of flagellin synthesis FlgM